MNTQPARPRIQPKKIGEKPVVPPELKDAAAKPRPTPFKNYRRVQWKPRKEYTWEELCEIEADYYSKDEEMHPEDERQLGIKLRRAHILNMHRRGELSDEWLASWKAAGCPDQKISFTE